MFGQAIVETLIDYSLGAYLHLVQEGLCAMPRLSRLSAGLSLLDVGATLSAKGINSKQSVYFLRRGCFLVHAIQLAHEMCIVLLQ